MTRPAYRTIGIAALGILALLAGLLVAGRWPAAVGAYSSFAFGVAGCVSAVAVKAWKEHQALAAAQAEMHDAVAK